MTRAGGDAVATLEERARRLDAWLGRHEWPLGALAAAGLLAFLIPLLVPRPLWFDELFTLYLARFDSLGELWRSLSSSGDFNPPLSYLAAAGLLALGASDEVAVRLPSLLAFVAFLALAYAWVSRLLSPLFGWLAALFLLHYCSYALEGRPYALMLAFFAAAVLLLWRRIDGLSGRWELPVLGACVALGTSSHFYFVPFVGLLMASAALRSWRRAAWDKPLWSALALGLVPLLLYLPILRYFRDFAAPGYWSGFHSRSLVEAYGSLTGSALASWLALALLAVTHVLRPGWFPAREPNPRMDAWILTLALAGAPLAGGLAALLTGGHFTPRHYAIAGLGVAALLALGAWRLGHGSRVACLVVAVVLALSAARSLGRERLRAFHDRETLAGDLAFLARRQAAWPILTCNPLWALKIAHASPAAEPKPVVFCDKGVPERSGARSLLALGDRAPLAMLPLQACLESSPRPVMAQHGRPHLDCYAPGEGPPREPGARRSTFTLYRLLPPAGESRR